MPKQRKLWLVIVLRKICKKQNKTYSMELRGRRMSDWQVRMAEEKGDRDFDYSEWVNRNWEELAEIYIDQIDYSDMPQKYQDECKTDDVEEWDKQLMHYYEDIISKKEEMPNDWLSSKYDNFEGKDI